MSAPDNGGGPLAAAEALLARGEPKRLARASSLAVRKLAVRRDGEGNFIAEGSVSGYTVSFKDLGGRRAMKCPCKDFEKRARRVGPCKHILALALRLEEHKNFVTLA